MSKVYDCIVIGAGSVGVPAAMAIAEKGLSVRVIESLSSPGQMNNKKAIGGIRATHSDYGKIQIGLRSIEIFSTWKEKHGDHIGWISNGYSYPAYNADDEQQTERTDENPAFLRAEHPMGESRRSIGNWFRVFRWKV